MILKACRGFTLVVGVAFSAYAWADTAGAPNAANPAPATIQPTETAVSEASPPAAAALVAPCDCIAVPALTPVSVELIDAISSATSVTGQTFRIKLAKPIVIDGVEVVPAGIEGMGEVVHAKKSGGSGVGGELIVAARYLMLGEQKIALRSMKLSATGKDQTTLAMATSQAIGPFAFAIRGKNSVFPVGSTADAKVSALVWVPRVKAAVAAVPADQPKDVAPVAAPAPQSDPKSGGESK